MEESRDHLDSYELRQVILYGAAGSSSLIFSVVLLLFLGSRLSDHEGMSTDTIGEMMGWAAFFFFSFTSYFSASLVVRRYTESFSRFGPSWLPISLVGSAAFSVFFMLFVYVSSIVTHRENDLLQNSPPTIWQLVLSIALLAMICSVLSLIGTALASGINDISRDKNGSASIITQK